MYFLYKDGVAIYKHKRYSRYYRQGYPSVDSQLKLYTTNSLQNVMRLRLRTYEYCNTWFDIYQDDLQTKVDLSDYDLKPQKCGRAILDTYMFQEETGTIYELFDISKSTRPIVKVYKPGRVLNIYRRNHWFRDYENTSKEQEYVLVASDNTPLITCKNWEYLYECSWIKMED